MRFAVFSDVHGNLPALEMMLADASHVDGYICLGDTVNYGPWSNECVERISALPNSVYIEGNHEEYFLSGIYPGGNIVAKTFFEFTYPAFTRHNLISNLPKHYELSGFRFSHTIQNRYIYPDTEIILDDNYVVGHSHHQFEISQPPFLLVNPGSVGQNRKHINIINYLIYDTSTNTFEPRKVKYDFEPILEEMKARGYPQLCIDYYNSKERA